MHNKINKVFYKLCDKEIVFIIHAGTVKTGSTFLQSNFFKNKDSLRRMGVDYPECSKKSLAIERFTNRDFLDLPTDAIESYIDDVIKDGCKYILLSEEGFWGDSSWMSNELLSRFEKIVVLYVRNPVELISSWVTERSKPYNADMNFNTDFSELLSFEHGLELLAIDYVEIFQKFLHKIKDSDNVRLVLRPYGSHLFSNHGIILDLLGSVSPEFFGIDLLSYGYKDHENLANKSVSRKYSDISAYLYYKLKDTGHVELYCPELVDYVYVNCKSGDERPSVMTLTKEQIDSISRITLPVSKQLMRIEPELKNVLLKKINVCNDYCPIDDVEIDFYLSSYIERQLHETIPEINLLRFCTDINSLREAWGQVNLLVSAPQYRGPSNLQSYLLQQCDTGISNIGQAVLTDCESFMLSVLARKNSVNHLVVQIGLDNNKFASFITFDLAKGTVGDEQELTSRLGLVAKCTLENSGWCNCEIEFFGDGSRVDVLFGVSCHQNSRECEALGSIYICNPKLIGAR